MIFSGEINQVKAFLYNFSDSYFIDNEVFKKNVKTIEKEIHISTSCIYDFPEVQIDLTRPPTINVLVPGFKFESISAGFFGVFQTAILFSSLRYHVRLVLFDTFDFNIKVAKQKIKNYPGLENLFDELEVDYIGERKEPLKVSKHDTSLATVWYSAYFAKKIQDTCDGSPFFYLIQDYETHFFPSSTNSILADDSYHLSYNAIFSTKTLQDYFLRNNIGDIANRKLQYIYYNNSCNSNLLPTYISFKNSFNKRKKHRLLFYSRPIVQRNMFELGVLCLIEAIKRGIFDEDNWEFDGAGLGGYSFHISEKSYLSQLPRMNLKEYMDNISEYDICLTLMASPHPSLVPFDLAGSGCIVVTNNFRNKYQQYFSDISNNIISKDPNLESILNGLEEAASKISNLEYRYKNAANMKYPKSWDETWSDEHRKWVDKLSKVSKERINL